MIPNEIVEAMSYMCGDIDRAENEIDDVVRNVALLKLSSKEQFSMFFMRYNLCGVISSRSIELLDLCFPEDEIYETTEWAKDVYNLSDQFVCLNSGEGEGFILLCKDNGKIYDVNVSELDDLYRGKITPKWEGYYDLIGWYLTVSEKRDSHFFVAD